MPYGQVVVGPPGSGKTTYCHGMQQFLSGFGRDVVVVNLDPASDTLPYKCALDLSELVTVTDVMQEMHLGPNGALVFCMEFLEKNIDWLVDRLAKLGNKYFIFDLPGQTELYTHHSCVKNILQVLQKNNYRLAAVSLVDSYYCSDAGNFISVLLMSMSAMMQLALPQVNVLSKADMIEKFGRLAFSLEFYTEVLKLDYLLDQLNDDPFFAKFKKMNKLLVGIVEDYSLVTFVPLNIQNKKSVLRVMQEVDKANGYCFRSAEERDIQAMFSSAMGAEFQYEKLQEVQEKYMKMSEADEEAMESEDS